MSLNKSQNDWEFEKFTNWIFKTITQPKAETDEPAVYMEIGAYAGESLYGVSKVLPAKSHIVVVDLADRPEATQQLNLVIAQIREEFGHNVTVFWGDSNNPTVVEGVTTYLKSLGRPLDLCFIDGNHSFKFAYNDYLNWRTMFNYVAFHDISQESIVKAEAKYGIEQAIVAHVWLMLKTFIPQFSLTSTQGVTLDEEQLWWEFIHPASGMGIGVVKT